MALTLADQYYMKALNGYDYDFEEVVENLNYALSYDQEHAGANYLMGKFYMEHLQKFDLAEEYLETSLSCDPESINTCESYARLLILKREFGKALKLINYAQQLSGVVKSRFYRLEALVYEKQKRLERAQEILYRAIEESCDSEFLSFLEEELTRVDKKIDMSLKVKYHLVG